MIAMPLTMYMDALENIQILRRLVADLESGATEFEERGEEMVVYDDQVSGFPELGDLVERAVELINSHQTRENQTPVRRLDLIKERLDEVQNGDFYVESTEDQYEDVIDPDSCASRAVLQLCYEGVVLIPDPNDHTKDRYVVESPQVESPVERLEVTVSDTKRAKVCWCPDLETLNQEGEDDECEELDSFESYVKRAAYKLQKSLRVDDESERPKKKSRSE